MPMVWGKICRTRWLVRLVEELLDHLQAVDDRLEGMCKALTALGSDYCAKSLPQLRDEDFVAIRARPTAPRAG